MNTEDMDWIERERVLVERATRYTRLATWFLAFACTVAMLAILAILVSAAAYADPGSVARPGRDPGSGAGDPRAAARELGRAGQAAAGAIARDAASADTVPGYAGAGVPERNLTAAGMAEAARAKLADPHDPGGAAGRAVIEGAVSRPDAPVPANDPAVRRVERIMDTPDAPAWKADGLASGSVSDCGAGVEDAGSGGACGAVTWCAGAGCGTVRAQSNTGFADAAARLNMALEMGGEEFDRGDMRFFKGKRRACTIRWGGLANCCRNSGLLVGLAGCSRGEVELGKQRHAGNTHYLGKRCAKRIFGVCIRRERAWCVFSSKLGRILHEQGRPQLGIGWSSCRGFTVAEIESIDFARLDLSEFTGNLTDGSMEPSLSLPGAGDTRAVMTDRIRDFYRRGE